MKSDGTLCYTLIQKLKLFKAGKASRANNEYIRYHETDHGDPIEDKTEDLFT